MTGSRDSCSVISFPVTFLFHFYCDRKKSYFTEVMNCLQIQVSSIFNPLLKGLTPESSPLPFYFLGPTPHFLQMIRILIWINSNLYQIREHIQSSEVALWDHGHQPHRAFTGCGLVHWVWVHSTHGKQTFAHGSSFHGSHVCVLAVCILSRGEWTLSIQGSSGFHIRASVQHHRNNRHTYFGVEVLFN